MGLAMIGFADALSELRPDLLLVLGGKKGILLYGQIVLCFMQQLLLMVTEKCIG